MSIHVLQEYKGRLTECPEYDWDNAPLDPLFIPVPDLQHEAVVAENVTVAGEQVSAQVIPEMIAINGAAAAVPAMMEAHRAI
jgi:hypothetical protein